MALLLFRAGGAQPQAVPLALVARLEDVAARRSKLSNGMPVVQYRGKLMPLVPRRRRPEFSAKAASPCWCSPTATAPWA